MKKIILILAVLLISTNVWAGKKATQKTLTISSVPVSAYVIANGVTATSDSVYQAGNVGFAALLMKVSGTIDVSYEVSRDSSEWYPPYTTDGSSLTAANTVVTGLTANRWIILTAKLAPYIRFKFTSTGSSTISSYYVWQDEN